MHYNLDTNEDFALSFTSKFITCFVDIHLHAFGLTLELKFMSIAYHQGDMNIYIEFWAFKVKSTQNGICG
jgi:hypothetical protein